MYRHVFVIKTVLETFRTEARNVKWRETGGHWQAMSQRMGQWLSRTPAAPDPAQSSAASAFRSMASTPPLFANASTTSRTDVLITSAIGTAILHGH